MRSAVLLAAVAVAPLLVGSWLHSRRRRRLRALREAMHELRRPLHALAMQANRGPTEAALLRQLDVAVGDLDAAIEGRSPSACPSRTIALAELLDDVERRWAGRANAVRVAGGKAVAGRIRGDIDHLGMAVDNLIANGLEHGGGDVGVECALGGGRVRLEVVNPDHGAAAAEPRASDPRRGHGLQIAARHAEEAEGALRPPRHEGGQVVTALDLPQADPGPEAA